MNILLVNDDGYDATGIITLKKLLSKYGKVVIVAPDSPRSGSGAALTIGKPIHVEKVDDTTFKCDGTPVDCTAFGLTGLNIDFDLVVSGCNKGINCSYDTMYSGTVGAALEALVHRKPAIAFSSPYNQDMSKLEKYFEEIWRLIMDHNLLSTEYFLNINFPVDEVSDIQIGGLSYRNDHNYFEVKEDGLYASRILNYDYEKEKGTDWDQINHGIISIVPISKYLYNPAHLEEIKKKLK